MKIRDIIDREQETLSMEVFPPKKDTDFEMVKEAALHIASLKPSFMSVTYGAEALRAIQLNLQVKSRSSIRFQQWHILLVYVQLKKALIQL